ncbi:hypothetical protein OF83DRAFT_1140029 [Amylostereum chailletii]|nr:hypothetical protein OF83DRAFT_1140029 [Amylostereum chailletii]
MDTDSPFLSEVESISDSDWLDISSHASDTESVGLPESDPDDAYGRPPSSHSSISSRSSSVDVWEGLLDQSDHDLEPDQVPEPHAGPAQSGTIRARTFASHRLAEELRVKEGLEQSMVSTLSTSRNSSLSASASSPASISRSRDLRLSFPDPLTPSRDELNRSYEEVAPVDRPIPDSFASDPQISESMEDPGRSATPEVLLSTPQPDLHVVLYGSPPSDKWEFVHTLLDKLAVGSGLTLSERDMHSQRTSIYWLNAKAKSHSLFDAHVISVADQTDTSQLPCAEDIPSLAIVFLPSLLPSLPQHTLFLPVVVSPSVDLDPAGFSEEVLREGVETQWDMMSVPSNQLLLWHVDSPSIVMSEAEVATLDPVEVFLGFEPLLRRRHRLLKSLRDQIAATPAMTIIAILSLVLGYIVSMTSPVSVSSANVPTEKDAMAAVLRVFTNASNQSHVSVSSPVTMSPLRDISVALANLPPSTLSTYVPASPSNHEAVHTPVAASSQTPAQYVSVQPKADLPSSPSLIPQSSTVLSLALPAAESKSLSKVQPAAKGVMASTPASDALYSLSTRLTSSLSDIFNVKVLAGVLYADMKELLDALDELIQVIGTQAANAVSLSKSTTEGFREHIRRGNRRAQDRARMLREKGRRALLSVRGQAWGRMERARKSARSLKNAIGESFGADLKASAGTQKQAKERVRTRMEERRAKRTL